MTGRRTIAAARRRAAPARGIGRLLRALQELLAPAAWIGRLQAKRYEPARHYMRGPGPKTRAARASRERGAAPPRDQPKP